MAAHFLRLKLAVLGGTFRRSPWQVVGMVIGLFYGLMVTVLAGIALVGARFVGDVQLVHDAVITAGSVVVVGFAVLPLIFGIDDSLDPRRFALFGLSRGQLASGLVAAGMIGIPSVATALIVLATVVTWSHSIGAVVVALVSAPLALLTCVLTARVTTSIGAFLLSTRRAKEIAGVAGLLLIVGGSVGLNVVVRLDAHVQWRELFGALAHWLAYTPLGAVWAAPADAALGDWEASLLRLVISVVVVALLAWAWGRLVGHMLVTPGREARAKSHTGLGWFDRVRTSPTGAVAARSLTYWARDSRYWMSLIMVPLMPVFIYIMLSVGGTSTFVAGLVPLPVMCVFLGWGLHNDVAYDGTAFWLHVASGTRGIHDRVGRLVPVLGLGAILLVAGSVVLGVVYRDPAFVAAIVGMSIAVLLTGLGLSSIFSALLPYPVVPAGQSPFANRQGATATAVLSQTVSLGVIAVWSAPSIVLGVIGLVLDSPALAFGGLVAGVVMGAAALTVGLLVGARIYDRRAPSLLAFSLRNA